MIVPGDNVAFRHGQLLHLSCYDDLHSGSASLTGDIRDLIADFLDQRATEYFCHTCLAQCLDVSRDDVVKALTSLRAIRRVRVAIGDCSHCDRPRVTLQAWRPTVDKDP